ncbi:MAG: permease [Syntrophales bacterium]
MDGISIGLWLMALIIGGIAFVRPEKRHREGLKLAWENIALMGPRITMAIVVAGFFAVILPTELVAKWLGSDSGMTGILVGSVTGGFTPGGPMLAFPIVVILSNAGAGTGPLIAYVTAWSVFAIHRLFAFELPLMGGRFAMLRLVSSLILPFLAGILAMLLDGAFKRMFP